eukprot:g16354.t1
MERSRRRWLTGKVIVPWREATELPPLAKSRRPGANTLREKLASYRRCLELKAIQRSVGDPYLQAFSTTRPNTRQTASEERPSTGASWTPPGTGREERQLQTVINLQVALEIWSNALKSHFVHAANAEGWIEAMCGSPDVQSEVELGRLAQRLGIEEEESSLAAVLWTLSDGQTLPIQRLTSELEDDRHLHVLAPDSSLVPWPLVMRPTNPWRGRAELRVEPVEVVPGAVQDDDENVGHLALAPGADEPRVDEEASRAHQDEFPATGADEPRVDEEASRAHQDEFPATGADEPDVVDNSHNSRPNQDFLKRVYEVVRVCQASSSFALFYWVDGCPDIGADEPSDGSVDSSLMVRLLGASVASVLRANVLALHKVLRLQRSQRPSSRGSSCSRNSHKGRKNHLAEVQAVVAPVLVQSKPGGELDDSDRSAQVDDLTLVAGPGEGDELADGLMARPGRGRKAAERAAREGRTRPSITAEERQRFAKAVVAAAQTQALELKKQSSEYTAQVLKVAKAKSSNAADSSESFVAEDPSQRLQEGQLVRALHNYKAQDEDELSFPRGC